MGHTTPPSLPHPLVVVDHQDSFTYNLVNLLQVARQPVWVLDANTLDVAALLASQPRGVLLSPGPGRPANWPRTLQLLAALQPTGTPLLGICLGHQLLAHHLGAPTVPAPEPMHGRPSLVYHQGQDLFAGLPNPLRLMRYHSLTVPPQGLPPGLRPTAHTADGLVMGLAAPALGWSGVQCHPESTLSPHGPQLVRNWLARLGTPNRRFGHDAPPNAPSQPASPHAPTSWPARTPAA